MMSDKIQATHLERTALVYVRQSSLQQVRDHTEGQRQQYALVERARALRFRETVLIDEELVRLMTERNYDLARRHYSFDELRSFLAVLIGRTVKGLY